MRGYNGGTGEDFQEGNWRRTQCSLRQHWHRGSIRQRSWKWGKWRKWAKVNNRHMIGFDSLVHSATSEKRGCMHEIYRKQKYKVETQDITWKTHNGGKNHDSPRAAEYTIRKEYNSGSARATTSSTSLFATRGGGYKMEATTSLSLSLSLCYTLCTTLLQYSTTL